eukprot:scaffold99400_cov55-Phaeocystis_antarctica.AAC.5
MAEATPIIKEADGVDRGVHARLHEHPRPVKEERALRADVHGHRETERDREHAPHRGRGAAEGGAAVHVLLAPDRLLHLVHHLLDVVALQAQLGQHLLGLLRPSLGDEPSGRLGQRHQADDN